MTVGRLAVMTITNQLALAHYDAEEARPIFDELVALYAEVYADRLDDEFFSVDHFTERLHAHSSRPGFELVTGRIDKMLVGYAYGVPLGPDTAWWNGLIAPVADEFVVESGERTFALNELMVSRRWRRHKVGQALHDELLRGRHEQRATLLVEQENLVAREAYRRWRWTQAGLLQPFPDAPVYLAMIRPLRDARSAVQKKSHKKHT